MNYAKIASSPMLKRFILALSLTVLLSACRVPETQPDPDVVPISVFYTPALRPVTTALQACAQEQPQSVLFIQEIPPDATQAESSGITLRLGEPAGELPYAAQITREALAVIVSAENPVESLSEQQLREIFGGEIKRWDSIVPFEASVQSWLYPQGDEITRIVDQALLAGQAVSTEALLAADPQAVIKGVGSEPGGIGFVPSAWLAQQSSPETQVKTVRLERSLAISLRRPVLAVTSADPQGAERDFLACLQNGAGQTVLNKRYSP
jgi:hypothetical protein